MKNIIGYVKTRSGKIYPYIKEDICCDPNEIHEGLCYVTPEGYAIDGEEVVKICKSLNDFMKDDLKEYIELMDSSNAPKFRNKSDFYYPEAKKQNCLSAWELYQGCVEQQCNDYGAKEIIEKSLKALEIIKYCCSRNSEYIAMAYYKDKLECGYITQEQYDLLREVLL